MTQRNAIGTRVIKATGQLVARYAHVNWALADQAMVSGVNFLTGILLARFLGLEEFGRFTLVWIAVLFVNSIQYAMINSPMMSIGPKQPEAEAPAYFGAVVVQQICFSGVMFVLLFAGVRLSSVVFPEWGVEGLALPLAVAALAFQFQDFLRRYFFTRERPAAAFANDTIRYLGQIAVLVWLLPTYGDTMDSAKVLWVIAITAGSAAACGAFFVESIEVNAATVRTTATRHWNFSKWLTASALLYWTSGNLFIIAAAALLGTTAVGALKAAQNIMGITHILFQGLENIVPVRTASHLKYGGRKVMFAYLRRVTILGGLATIVVAAVAAAAPAMWLGLIYGKEYQGYGFLLQWYAVAYVLIYLSLPLRSALRALETTQPIFSAYVLMTLFSVFAAYPLVSSLNLTGVMLGLIGVNGILVVTLALAVTRKSDD